MFKYMDKYGDYRIYVAEDCPQEGISAAITSVLKIYGERVKEQTKVNQVFVRYTDLQARIDFRRKEMYLFIGELRG